MNDVCVLCIRIGENFPKVKWEADALLAEVFEKIRILPDFDVRYAANAGDKLPPLQTVGTPIAGEP